MSSRIIIMREATIRIVRMLSEKDVKVTQRGSKAFVEYGRSGRPSRVNIPYIPDDATDELLDAIQGFIDHEVAHILFTDWNVLVDADKLRVGRLHNIFEDAYIERRMAEHFPGSGSNLRNVGKFFLSTFTDKKLKENPGAAEGLLIVPAIRAWAGQTVYIDYMADKWHYLDRIVKAVGSLTSEVAKCASSRDCLNLTIKFRDALEPARREEESTKPKPKSKKPPEPEDLDDDMPLPSGEIDPSDSEDSPGRDPEIDDTDDDEFDDGSEDTSGSEGSEPSDPSSEGGSGEPAEEPSEGEDGIILTSGEDGSEDEGEAPEGSDDTAEFDPKIEAKPVVSPPVESEDAFAKSDEGDGEDMDDVTTESAISRETDDGDDDTPISGTSSDDSEDPPVDEDLMSALEESMSKVDFDDAIAEALTKMSAEGAKEADYLVYTTELDIVEPMPVPRGLADGHMKIMMDSVDHMIGPLQKDLERAVAARSAATWSAGHRSGRLHPSALARLTVFNDDRVFRRRHVNDSKDVAVELLVDCSGSMTGSKIKTAAYAAYGLSSVLDRMMIANEVMGFTTKEMMPSEMSKEARELGVRYARNEGLYHPVLKSFNERMTSETKRRFSALPTVNWLSENVDGESVQFVANRLMQRREKRKILFVLSDGQPACPGDFTQLTCHLKKTVKAIEASGIDVIAIGIESDAPRHFYKKNVVLKDVASLPTVVMAELKKLMMQ